jgi:uncharacterized membrane protein
MDVDVLRSFARRAGGTVLAATVLAVAVGYLRSGSVGGGLAFGLAAFVGVTVGLAGFELATGRLSG